MPFFSVILPTYNRATMIGKAIDSVIGQTYNDWELIIVDDGSTDDTEQVVRQFNDPRIKYCYQKNQERSAARNNGIDKAAGKFICFLDSDDFFLEQHLSSFKQKIDSAKVDHLFIYSGYDDSVQSYQPKNHFEELLLYPVSPPRVCISKQLLTKEKFDEKLKLSEDTELWMRILKHNPQVIQINHQTVNIVEHDGRSIRENVQAQYVQNIRFAKQIKALYEKSITDLALKTHISNLEVSLGFQLIQTNKTVVLKRIFKSIWDYPLHRTKEKIVLLLASLGLKSID